MKIAMFTNTYLPHVGGVARSVKTLEDACRGFGHEVKVIAPEFDGAEPSHDVLRVPAIQHFNGSDFCVRLPVPNRIRDFIADFRPDVIHSHHPFLLGDAALREAWKWSVPLVFTHHTLYERYTHYIPMDLPAFKRIAIQLATEYCGLCDLVVAPSDSIARLLSERGVETRVEVVPTGIDVGWFSAGDGARFRAEWNIPADALVIGHVGRLAKEKNLSYLADAVSQCLERKPDAVFLLVGDGEAAQETKRKAGPPERVRWVGCQSGRALADAYAAMDVFAFASQTETQGIVLAEAMAAGKPVVALDGSGVREVVVDGENGFLLDADATPEAFEQALLRLLLDPDLLRRYGAGARESAAAYDRDSCARRMVEGYETLLAARTRQEERGPMLWDRLLNSLGAEWDLLAAKLSAAAAAVAETPATQASLD
jgi:glycosyltransferase involved in cell wall biosynthesis